MKAIRQLSLETVLMAGQVCSCFKSEVTTKPRLNISSLFL